MTRWVRISFGLAIAGIFTGLNLRDVRAANYVVRESGPGIVVVEGDLGPQLSATDAAEAARALAAERALADTIVGSTNPIPSWIINSTSPVPVWIINSTNPIPSWIINSTSPVPVWIINSTSPIPSRITAATNPIPSWITAATNAITNLIVAATNPISGRIAASTNPIPSWITAATNPIPSWITAATNPIPSRITAATNPIPSWITAATNAITNLIVAATNPISGRIAASTNPIPSWIINSTSPIPSWIINSTSPIPSWIINSTSPIPSRITAATNPIPGWITAATNPIPGLINAATNPIAGRIAAATSPIPSWIAAAYTPGHYLYVDNSRTDSFTSDGTIMRPFRTVSAAMTAIGDETSVNDWRNSNSERFYTVKVMPGVYPENVVIPWRPYLTIELSSALIAGNLVRTNAFNMIPDGGGGDPRCTTVVIKGDSLRSGYADGNHSYVGVSGKVTFQLVEGSDMPPFNELHVIQAGIRGGVTYQGQSSLQSTSTIHMAHIFLRDAMVGTIVATNDWSAYLFAYGWGGGHQGGGPAGSGIGPLIGSVCPYNLQSTLISGGVNLTPISGSTLIRARWHNVLFETGFAYNTTNTNYSIDLDTASYNSWLAASTLAERAKWKTGVGGSMYLTDIDILPSTTYPLPSGALWNSNGVPRIVP